MRQDFPVPQCYPLCSGDHCCGSSGVGVVTYQRVSPMSLSNDAAGLQGDMIQMNDYETPAVSQAAGSQWKELGNGCCAHMPQIPAYEKVFDQMYSGNCFDKCAQFGSSLAIVFKSSWCTCMREDFPVPQCYPVCSGESCCGSNVDAITYQRISPISLSTDATVSQGGMIQITNYNTPECTGTASTSQTPSGQCTDASWGSSMYVCSDDGTGYGKTVTRIQYQCQKCACAAQFTSQSVSGSCHSFWEGGHTVATCLASDVIALV